jgi:hypothetical protein
MAAEDYREQAGGCRRRDSDEQGRSGMENIENNTLHSCDPYRIDSIYIFYP